MSRFSLAYCRAICFFALVEICSADTFSDYVYLFFLYFTFCVLLINNIFFCFSCSGWGIGPSGGVIEPDLVAKMRSDEGPGGNFFYGPAVMVPYREPFANERYLFGKYHDCEKYAELERKFISENEEVMREVFFDTNNLLGVDSEEDVDEEDAVNYDDLGYDILSEENQLHHAAVRKILETKIVRVSPVNWESEDEETMERVTSPMVVEAVSVLPDTSVATGSADSGVNNQSSLVIAANADCVEKIVRGRAKLPSDPGPFSEDVSMDNFMPRPRRGSVLFLAFSDAAGDEVSLYFLLSYPVVYILLLNSGA